MDDGHLKPTQFSIFIKFHVVIKTTTFNKDAKKINYKMPLKSVGKNV